MYGYTTPLKMKIVIAFALSDATIRDAEVQQVCNFLHTRVQ